LQRQLLVKQLQDQLNPPPPPVDPNAGMPPADPNMMQAPPMEAPADAGMPIDQTLPQEMV